MQSASNFNLQFSSSSDTSKPNTARYGNLPVSAVQKWTSFSVAMWITLNANYGLAPLFEFSSSDPINFLAFAAIQNSPTTARFWIGLREDKARDSGGVLFGFNATTSAVTLSPIVWRAGPPLRSLCPP